MVLKTKKTELVLRCTNRNVTLEIRDIYIAVLSMAEALAGKQFWTPHSTEDVHIQKNDKMSIKHSI